MDELMEAYRKHLPSLGGYLCKQGRINFRRLEPILKYVGRQEEAIFKTREKQMERFRQRQIQDQRREAKLLGRGARDGNDEGGRGGRGGGRGKAVDPEDEARSNAMRGATDALSSGTWRHGTGRAGKAGDRAAVGEDDGDSADDDEDGDAASDGGSVSGGVCLQGSDDFVGGADPNVILMNAAKATAKVEGKGGAAAAAMAAFLNKGGDPGAPGSAADPSHDQETLKTAMRLRKQLSLGSGVDDETAEAEVAGSSKGEGKGQGTVAGLGSAVAFLEGLPAADPAVADTTDRAAAEAREHMAGEGQAPAGSIPSDGTGASAAHAAGPSPTQEAGTEGETAGSSVPAANTPAAAGLGDGFAFNEADSPEDQAVGAVLRRLAQWGRLNARERYYLEKFGVSCDMRVQLHARVHHAVRRAFAESLQWCMLYYYQGVPSWSWFFPFHYAPFTSDLIDMSRYAAPVAGAADASGPSSGGGSDAHEGSLEFFEEGWKYKIEFDHARPFHPFMQLLGCLPAASSNFLPECYRRLMAERTSPLAQWFPLMQDIRVDMNGKKNPWEGVTLIPFLPEIAMRSAVATFCPDSAMTPDERARNSFGEDIEIQYQPQAVPGARPVPSTLPGAWPSLKADHSIEKPWTNPDLPASGFDPVPCPGARMPAPGFPTLHTMPVSPLAAEASLVTVAFRSRKPSVLLFVSERGRMP